MTLILYYKIYGILHSAENRLIFWRPGVISVKLQLNNDGILRKHIDKKHQKLYDARKENYNVYYR